jgi:hypothetical protein
LSALVGHPRVIRLVVGSVSSSLANAPDASDIRDAEFFAPARARSGRDPWDAALREGSAMSFEEAVAYAVGERLD